MPLLGGHFDDIQDPRRDHGQRHALSDIFALTLCAVIAGADNFVAVEAFGKARLDWLRRFLPLKGGIPSPDTLSRVFALVDRAHFEEAFATWATEAFERTEGQTLALDAASGCAALTRRAMMSVVSAWATDSGVALGQVSTTEGEGEIAALPRLLRLLDLSGCVVTIDAAGCQTTIARLIKDGGGDYVLAAKNNQPGLREDCEAWLAEAASAGTLDMSRADRAWAWTCGEAHVLVGADAGEGHAAPHVEGPTERGVRRVGTHARGQDERRAPVLCYEPAGGCPGAGARRARALGRGARAALDARV